jgi:FixJ family two-component response regulator
LWDRHNRKTSRTIAKHKKIERLEIRLPNSPVISIIDDDAFVRDAIGDLIRSLGYQAATYSSAQDFLKSDTLAETNCVITDLQMPGLSGLDLQRHLISEGFRTPIIFVTAFPKDNARATALNSGAVAFLSKPFEESKLIQSIELALKDASHQDG